MKYQKMRKTIYDQGVKKQIQKPTLQKEPITYDKAISNPM